jgi:hypothetical protein
VAETSSATAARRAFGLVAVLAAVLALASSEQGRWHAYRQAELGETLLQGAGPDRLVGAGRMPADSAAMVLRGRLAGHPGHLPPEATRCVNCHATGASAARPAAVSFGPSLDATLLVRALPRRGGPPSRYDADSLCRLLREGIDPAWVVVDASMPRYDISDAQCEALWMRLARPSVS